VNTYIRQTHDFDGYIDFDALMRDPSDPTKLKATFDFGDHIHPNDVGTKAMADYVSLKMLLDK
jgi:hypothetical protein